MVASGGTSDAIGITISVVDEVTAVGRCNHVIVEIERNLLVLGWGEVGGVVLGADEANFFSGPPAETNSILQLVARASKAESKLNESNGTRSIIVDTLIKCQ